MAYTTDEINLQRLLFSCEEKLKNEKLETWTGSEKQKFATYVHYLRILQERTRDRSKINYDERIAALTRSTAPYTMNLDVAKGIPEAQLTKARHMDWLKQQHKPEPDWVQSSQDQGQPTSTQADEEESEAEEKALEEKALNEAKKENTKMDNEEEAQRLRRRFQTRDRQPSGTADTEEGDREETANIEHVLQHHRQMHDELTTELTTMAKQLKFNTQSFGDILAKDDRVLRDAQDAVETNLERMRKERQRLDEHYSKSWGTSFMTFGVVLFVCVMFFLVFFTIKFLPKAS
ncbi:vesicle transport protein [Radiomyces spectabilis]|uniref:vesicle transport protein n=1 Tax=Radiomyces spectabilis TaxID=64574 RepID=UPI002220E4B1|nr:vesicle transport protein [Radiomyces spectabilis]KAI8367696.1 vesicle transport protein [Radiomyces spectabilis]